jgi:hypothetical protein
MGVEVEASSPGFAVADPIVDRPLPGGRAHLSADPSRALLRVDGVGTFAVAEGRRIRFDPEEDIPEGAVSMWLHGTVAALLLAQRGRFALHASVVEIGGVAVAVAGPRRAGKSTAALRLAQMGHAIVTDDVSPLHASDPVTVVPYARPLHVFAETAVALGIDVSDARPLLPDHPKLAIPSVPRSPIPLGAVAVLRPSETAIAVRSDPVHGAEAHWLVTENIYRAELFGEVWGSEMFRWAAAVAARVPVEAVSWPRGVWTVDEVARAVEGIAGAQS